MRVEEQYADVLQNIEMAVVAVFDDDPALHDLLVLDALETLIRRYTCEEQGQGSGKRNLLPNARRVHDTISRTCEWRLGRAPLNEDEAEGEGAVGIGEAGIAAISVSEILLCLKRLRQSVRLWHGEGGRQGYLNYVRGFLAHAERMLGR